MTLNIAVAQINCTVGNLAGNRALIEKAAQDAAARGAHIVLTPELSLTGYPPEDLLFQGNFQQAVTRELQALCQSLKNLKGLYVIVGYPRYTSNQSFNACAVLCEGQILATYDKQALPNDAVFDEKRYFQAGNTSTVLNIHGTQVGLLVCEDIWQEGPAAHAKEAGAELLLIANSSPYSEEKQAERLQAVRTHASALGLPCIYCNMVGAQDELAFDGQSFALDANGDIKMQLPHCQSALEIVTFDKQTLSSTAMCEPISLEQAIYDVLVMGVRDYIQKNGFPGAIIGLSGGVDSALVLAIAVDALGVEHVRAVMMPSQYTSDMSTTDADLIAKTLGVRYDTLAIETCYQAFEKTLAAQFAGLSPDATEENLQARIRGTLLMALSNKTGALVLTTGNKSELAVGYCTLYGDMAGGFAVIKDVYKTMVYRLCRYRNSLSQIIPERVLMRAPSAELRFDQCDQDNLPPYEVLDHIICAFMEQGQSVDDIVASGIDRDIVVHVITLLRRNEYKRRQAPIGTRITTRAFGRDWRCPITSKFRD